MVDDCFQQLALIAFDVAPSPRVLDNHVCGALRFHPILELKHMKPGVQDWIEVRRSNGTPKFVDLPSLDSRSHCFVAVLKR